MSKESRELTHDEMKTEFLQYIHALVDYWEHEDRAATVKDKLDGLAFSILNAIDGGSAELPAYALIPLGNPDDIEYCQSIGRNYYPEETEDIAGALHDNFMSSDGTNE